MATWTSRCLESEREQRNSGWSRSAHTPIKRISEHRDTISCHPLCCTNDLIDMKGRCCPKIVVSTLEVCLHPGNYDTSEASYRKQRFRYDEKFMKKWEVDIISRYKWWINEELHRWSFDKPLKIVYHWYLKYLFNSGIVLGDCAMAFPFHVVDDFIPENTS